MTKQVEPLAGHRQKGESQKAVMACNDWLRLGAGRSLSSLLRFYAETGQVTPPTSNKHTLKHWSAAYGWQDRSVQYDTEIEKERAAQAKAAMGAGLALAWERVKKLKTLADFLEGQLYEQGAGGEYHNVWLPDVKQIGSGEYAERVDIERFNGALVQQYRDTLDDLAKEVGERVKKLEHAGTGPDGAIVHQVRPYADMSDDQLQELLGGD